MKHLPLLIIVSISLLFIFTDSRYVYGEQRECSDLHFLYLRASGQSSPQPTKIDGTSGEYDGQPEGKQFEKILSDRLPREIKFTSESLNYPAFGELPEIAFADWDIGDKTGKYWTSKKRGTEMLVDRVNLERVRCPNQQIVIGGYSQGAHAVGDALYQLGEDQASNVTYIGMFGDPRFNQESWAARGNFRKKAFGRSGGILETREEYPNHFKERLESWCYHNDGFCDNRASRAMKPSRNTHGRYPEDGAIEIVANNAALQVLKKFEEQSNLSLDLRRAPVFGNKYDIVFVVDRAKTMAKTMADARKQVDYFLANSLIKEADVRLGIVTVDEYRDNQGIYRPIVTNQATLGSVSNFKYEWSRFTINGGGTDTTSPMLSGISQASDSLSWRSDAEKHLIVMTDQPMKQTEFFSGKSLGEVVKDTRGKDIRINLASSVASSDDIPNHKLMFESLYEPTDGGFFATHQFITHLMLNDVFTAINELPIIKTQQQYTGTPGKPVDFNLGDSYSPAGERIMTYDWDFDGNGTYEYTTAYPQMSHIYPEPFTGLAKVRVTTNSGKRTTGKISVRVDENTHYFRPNAPSGVVVDFYNRKLRIRWITPNRSSKFINPQKFSIIKSLFPVAFATELSDEDLSTYTIHDSEGGLLKIVQPEEGEIEIPDSVKAAHSIIGIAAHDDESSSDIVYYNIPVEEEPKLEEPVLEEPTSPENPSPVVEPDPATKDPLPIQTPNNPEIVESPVDESESKSNVAVQSQITKSEVNQRNDAVNGNASVRTSESTDAEISQQDDSADLSRNSQNSKNIKGKVLAQKDRGLPLPLLYALFLIIPATFITLYRLKSAQ